jgi:hypothetical protein
MTQMTVTCAIASTVALLGAHNDVSAAESRTHSSQCTYYYDDAGTGVYNGVFLFVYDTPKNIYCPVPSDSAVPHSATSRLNIHGFTSKPNGSYTRACAHDAWSSVFECGPTRYWTANNTLVAQSVNTSLWREHSDWFPYLMNFLEAGAQLYGFWMST